MIGKFTLENFYRSDEWYKLTQQIKLDRLDENDQLICWHCHKPITKAYDCICHHTLFLTEDNVNDAAVSLNPDLIKLVHHRCHNIIHNKLGYSKREIFIVYGAPLSGKHEYVNQIKEPGDLIINLDEIWKSVSGLNMYERSGKLNAVVFKIRDELINCVKYRIGKWDNAYIIGGYPLISERERLSKELGARLIYIESSKEECIQKAKDLNLPEYEKYIDDWWKKYAPHMH